MKFNRYLFEIYYKDLILLVAAFAFTIACVVGVILMTPSKAEAQDEGRVCKLIKYLPSSSQAKIHTYSGSAFNLRFDGTEKSSANQSRCVAVDSDVPVELGSAWTHLKVDKVVSVEFRPLNYPTQVGPVYESSFEAVCTNKVLLYRYKPNDAFESGFNCGSRISLHNKTGIQVVYAEYRTEISLYIPSIWQ